MADAQLSLPSVGADWSTEWIHVIPLTGAVVFPHMVIPLAITEPGLAGRMTESVEGIRRVALLTVRPGRDSTERNAGDPPFFPAGTLGQVLQGVKMPDGTARVLVQGQSRLRVTEFARSEDGWNVRVEPIETADGNGPRVEALHRMALTLFRQIVGATPALAQQAEEVLARITEPGQLADFIGGNLQMRLERKQELLAEPSVAARLERLVDILGEERRVLEFGTEIQERLRAESSKTQREHWLREQLRIIQQELGEGAGGEVEDLRKQVEAAGMPEAARKQADRELERLERMHPQAADHPVVRNYLDWLVALPWSKESEERIELDHSREVLDRDHYDLDAVKERIIEYLAVRKLNPELHSPILCFVGPPGVGKTSMGRSIADALGRAFVRASLGGVHDEAEIRGHRRTYVGAMPGRIVQGIRNAGTRDPVMMLDEIDKLGQDFRGDPTSALLEVLDPAQNSTFSDHFLEVPFDLSRVMFLATANTLATVPPALRDRLEVLTLPGYTSKEKLEIAKRFLIPRQRRDAGLRDEQVSISERALRALIRDYTRESGVRELERQIGRLMRKVAVQIVEEGRMKPVRITRQNLGDLAGKRRFETELAGRQDEVGTATGLAYSPEGGQILFVEAVSMPGGGNIRLTGQLGEVMKESAQAALSYVHAHAEILGVPAQRFRKRDVHIHVPAGATPKDGPSAGLALLVALASLFTGRAVRREVAMTGEVTLRGHVLPVGGIKEKVIAAEQAGIQTVLLPRRSEADLEDVPQDVRQKLQFILVDEVGEALAHALKPLAPARRRPRKTVRKSSVG